MRKAATMNGQLYTTIIPEILIPKALKKQAAETCARNLVSVSLPLIKALAYKKPQASSPEDDKETPKDGKELLKDNPMLDQLKRLKSWYWEEQAQVFGGFDSETQSMISRSLMEVIDMNENFRSCEPLHRFALQLLFTCEAGDMGRQNQTRIETQITRQFSEFLLSMAPFYIRELRDPCIRFSDAFPVILIMINSSDLRRIQLFRNICDSSLKRLRMNCIKAEIITLDFEIEKGYSHLVSDDLYKTFFGNSEKDVVLQLMDTGKAVPQSFPNLKEVCIRSDHILKSLTSFVQCLQYSYCKVTIKVSCLTSVPYDRWAPKSPFVTPTFQVVGLDDYRKMTSLYFTNEGLEIDEATGPSPSRVVDAHSFIHSYNIFVSNTSYMQKILSMLQVGNLRYIFNKDVKLEVSPQLPLLLDKLRVLYIFGPIFDESADESLAESLNQCPDLRVLCFSVKLMIAPVLEGLNPLMNLKVLSVYFTPLTPCSAVVDSRFPKCLKPSVNEDDAENFLELLILAAPNLEVLEVPCMDVLLMLIDNGFLKKIHTLSVTLGHFENIKSCVLNLPSLKTLLLDRFMDFKTFLELKRCFNYSSLIISYKKGRLVKPFIL